MVWFMNFKRNEKGRNQGKLISKKETEEPKAGEEKSILLGIM